MTTATNIDSPRLLGVSETARRLTLSENTVRRLADLGELPCERDASRKRLFNADAIERIRRSRSR